MHSHQLIIKQFLCGFIFLFFCAVSHEAQSKLIIGSEEEYPPFSIGYTDETADGFTVELWKAVADKSKLDYVIKVKPFKTLIEEIETGKVDVLINLAQSDERKNFVDFTIPHVTVSGGIFVRPSDKKIRSEKDLKGKEVIVLNGDLAHDYAKSKEWGSRLILVDSAQDGFNLLASGKHDAIVISKLAGEKTIKQIQAKNIKLLETNVGFQQKFSFAVSKGNSELLAKINEGLALVKESGQYDDIYNKWFAIYNLEPPLFSDAFYFSITFSVFALIFAGYLFYKSTADRRKSEDIIRETNKNFENILSAASQFSIIATDLQGMIITFNSGAQLMLGYNPYHVLSQINITKLHNRSELELRRSKQSDYFKRSLTEFEALVFKALSEEFDKFECEYITEDDRRVSILLNVTPMRNSDDKLIGYLFIAQDITERKQLESVQIQYLDQLRQSEAQKSAILESAPDAIMIMNQDGNFVEFNPAAEKMFDYQRSEVIGKKVGDMIMSSEHRVMHDEGMKAYVKSGKSKILGRRIEVPALRRDKSQFPLEMVIIPFDLDEEQFFLSFARDITELSKKKYELLQEKALMESNLVNAVNLTSNIRTAVKSSLVNIVELCNKSEQDNIYEQITNINKIAGDALEDLEKL